MSLALQIRSMKIEELQIEPLVLAAFLRGARFTGRDTTFTVESLSRHLDALFSVVYGTDPGSFIALVEVKNA
jgi:hypothetical protein